MTVRAVHWHEGMFLWPQQMQQAERFYAHQVHLGGTWDTHYNWGLRALDLDQDALANHRFLARGLRARLRDGTMVNVPEDVVLGALDLKDALEAQPNVTVLLAVPTLRLGKANSVERAAVGRIANPPQADDGQGDARYIIATQDLEDENTGADSQPIHVRFPNAKLLLSTQSQAGYAVVPLARVKRAHQPEGKPELDADYIPPVLSCEAWKPLQAGILQVVYDRFGRKIAKLAAQVVTRGISFDTRNAGDALVLAQLQDLNEAYAYLKVLAFAIRCRPMWNCAGWPASWRSSTSPTRAPRLCRTTTMTISGAAFTASNNTSTASTSPSRFMRNVPSPGRSSGCRSLWNPSGWSRSGKCTSGCKARSSRRTVSAF
jgi:type VI secretion system protein ImpJ